MQDGDLIIIYKVEHIQNEASFFLAIIWVDFFFVFCIPNNAGKVFEDFFLFFYSKLLG